MSESGDDEKSIPDEKIFCNHCCKEDVETTACEICNTLYCCECSNMDIVDLNEWLSIESTCSKCKRTSCQQCISACHTCANWGNQTPTVCNECSMLTSIKCKYHVWDICDQCHAFNFSCGQCDANARYAQRASFVVVGAHLRGI